MAKRTKAEINTILDQALDPTLRGSADNGTLYSLLQDLKDSLSVTQTYDLVGDNVSTTFNIVHNMGTRWINVDIVTNDDPNQAFSVLDSDASYILKSDNDLDIVFTAAPADDENFKIIITG